MANMHTSTMAPIIARKGSLKSEIRGGGLNGLIRRLSFTQLLAISIIIYVMLAVSSIGCQIHRTAQRAPTPVAKKTNNHTPHPSDKDGFYALSMAHKANVDRVISYIMAWSRYSPNTRLVIFTDPNLLQNSLIKSVYSAFHVEGIPFQPPPEILDPEDDEEIRKIGNVALHRVLVFRDYIEDHPEVKSVMLAASADDVILQGDPWTHPVVKKAISTSEGHVMTGMEGGPLLGNITVKEDLELQKGSLHCFGRGPAENMYKQTIAHADVVFGTGAHMGKYLRELHDIVSTRVRARCLAFPRPDIIAHNYILHELNKDPRQLNFKIHNVSAIDSPVFPAQYAMPAVLDGRGKLQRKDAMKGGGADDANDGASTRSIPVVSQYTTHPALVEHFGTMYKYRPQELQFAQKSNYGGTKLGDKPQWWSKEASKETVVMDDMVDEE